MSPDQDFSWPRTSRTTQMSCHTSSRRFGCLALCCPPTACLCLSMRAEVLIAGQVRSALQVPEKSAATLLAPRNQPSLFTLKTLLYTCAEMITTVSARKAKHCANIVTQSWLAGQWLEILSRLLKLMEIPHRIITGAGAKACGSPSVCAHCQLTAP